MDFRLATQFNLQPRSVDPLRPTDQPEAHPYFYSPPRQLVPTAPQYSPRTTLRNRLEMGWQAPPQQHIWQETGETISPTVKTRVHAAAASAAAASATTAAEETVSPVAQTWTQDFRMHRLGLGYPFFLLNDYTRHFPRDFIYRSLNERLTLGRDYKSLKMDVPLVDSFISRHQCEIFVDVDCHRQPSFRIFNTSNSLNIYVDDREICPQMSCQLYENSIIEIPGLGIGEEFDMNYIQFKVVVEMYYGNDCRGFVANVFPDLSAQQHEGAKLLQAHCPDGFLGPPPPGPRVLIPRTLRESPIGYRKRNEHDSHVSGPAARYNPSVQTSNGAFVPIVPSNSLHQQHYPSTPQGHSNGLENGNAQYHNGYSLAPPPHQHPSARVYANPVSSGSGYSIPIRHVTPVTITPNLHGTSPVAVTAVGGDSMNPPYGRGSAGRPGQQYSRQHSVHHSNISRLQSLPENEPSTTQPHESVARPSAFYPSSESGGTILPNTVSPLNVTSTNNGYLPIQDLRGNGASVGLNPRTNYVTHPNNGPLSAPPPVTHMYHSSNYQNNMPRSARLSSPADSDLSPVTFTFQDLRGNGGTVEQNPRTNLNEPRQCQEAHG